MLPAGENPFPATPERFRGAGVLDLAGYIVSVPLPVVHLFRRLSKGQDDLTLSVPRNRGILL